MTRQQKKTAKVITTQVIVRAKKQKKNNNRVKKVTQVISRYQNPRSLNLPSMSVSQKRYLEALKDPFSESAWGCKVPISNRYGASTACVKWQGYMTGSGAHLNGASGDSCYLMLNPNPVVYGYASGARDSSLSTSYQSFGNIRGPINQVPIHNPVTSSGGSSTYGFPGMLIDHLGDVGSSVPYISNTLNTFRTVCSGIRIRSLLSADDTPVFFETQYIPLLNTRIPYQILNGTNSRAQNSSQSQYEINTYGGLQYGNSNNQFTSSPNPARHFTSTDIAMGVMCFPFSPISPKAFDFRSLDAKTDQSTGSAGAIIDYDDVVVVDQATGTPAFDISQGNVDELTQDEGWEGIYMQVLEGSTAVSGTLGQKIFSVEFICHIEGTQAITNVGNSSQNHVPFTSVMDRYSSNWTAEELCNLAQRATEAGKFLLKSYSDLSVGQRTQAMLPSLLRYATNLR